MNRLRKKKKSNTGRRSVRMRSTSLLLALLLLLRPALRPECGEPENGYSGVAAAPELLVPAMDGSSASPDSFAAGSGDQEASAAGTADRNSGRISGAAEDSGWDDSQSVSVEGEGSPDSGQALPAEEGGDWDSGRTVSSEGNGDWDSGQPLPAEENGDWNSGQPLPAEGNGDWNSGQPLPAEGNGDWNSGQALPAKENGSCDSGQTFPEGGSGITDSSQTIPGEGNADLNNGLNGNGEHTEYASASEESGGFPADPGQTENMPQYSGSVPNPGPDGSEQGGTAAENQASGMGSAGSVEETEKLLAESERLTGAEEFADAEEQTAARNTSSEKNGEGDNMDPARKKEEAESETEALKGSRKDPDGEFYDYAESMTIEELRSLDDSHAGAATQLADREVGGMFPGKRFLFQAGKPGSLWTFDVYYVNQEDPYHVSKRMDFTLKYQAEFHTSTDLDPNCVLIRVPAALLTDRSGRDHLPDEIGVPQGSMQEGGATPSPDSPFNWYPDGDDLVFFNYRPIRSGTNTAFQVLYRGLKISEITDGTSWSLQPSIRVLRQGAEEWEEKIPSPLSGDTDSTAELASASAAPLTDPSRKYTPALYTRKQVESVLGLPLPKPWSEHPDDYVFVAWELKTIGTGSQPWLLTCEPVFGIKGAAQPGGGEFVGMQTWLTGDGGRGRKIAGTEIRYEDLQPYLPDQNAFSLTGTVVAAYPKALCEDGVTVFTMDTDVTLHPSDGLDQDSCAKARAEWTFLDYKWTYSGNTIGIRVYTGRRKGSGGPVFNKEKDVSYPGWTDEFRAACRTGKDAGHFHFEINGYCRGYETTHIMEGNGAGSYIPGSRCEVCTVSDAAYVIAQTGQQEGSVLMLQPEDYRFNAVRVTITDNGIDRYEDEESPPMPSSGCPGVDRSVRILAMFRGEEDWKEVAAVPWEEDGSMTYSFTEEQIAQEPWRVMAVHSSTDYVTRSRIELEMEICPGSQVSGLFCAEDPVRADQARIECLGGISGRGAGPDGAYGSWMQDQRTDGAENYSEPGIEELTRRLYNVILMRDSSFVSLTGLGRHAQAVKTAEAVNDPEHSRVRLFYTVAAVEGYELYDISAAKTIAEAGTALVLPDREGFAVYDLLPHGVSLDPSVPVTGGLLEGQENADFTSPSRWDTDPVTVSISGKTDIMENWRGSGRTMLVFHVRFHKNPSMIPRFASGMWFDGYGIRFGAFCSYRDLAEMQKEANLAAVMPEKADIAAGREILGTDKEAGLDDGVVVPATEENRAAYGILGKDIDSDGAFGLKSVLYAKAAAAEDVAVGLTSGITKWVRTDSDRFASFQKEAVTGGLETYTYRIDLTNETKDPITGIVIFDHLEQAALERPEAELSMNFEELFWEGSFEGADLSEAAKKGINPVLYYSASEEAPLPLEGQTAEEILTEENGWIREESWTEDLSKVRSIAADLSRGREEASWQLKGGDRVRIFLHMKAPADGGEARYAYNCSSFYSEGIETQTQSCVTGNSVRVRLSPRRTLIVRKKTEGEVPDGRKDQEFIFRVKKKEESGEQPCAGLEYSLENYTEKGWEADGKLHATDADGRFLLKDGQRAVFEDAAGTDDMTVSEDPDLFFACSMEEESGEDARSIVAVNHYRPPLLLEKRCLAVPDGVSLEGRSFRVRVSADGNSMAGQTAWIMDPLSALTFSGRKLGERVIDEDSCISISPGELLALFPGDADCSYTVEEMEESFGEGTDFIGVSTDASGLLALNGSRVTLENAWRWKDLLISKKILHREAEDCDDLFTFRIRKLPEGTDPSAVSPGNLGTDTQADGFEPAAGLSWELSDGSRSGVTDAEGCLSCACAGKTVVVKGLEGGRVYTVQETEVPVNYTMVNSGTAVCLMPVYSKQRGAEITNSYRLRDLDLSKLVLENADRDCTLTATEGYPGRIPSSGQEKVLFDYEPEEDVTGYRSEFPTGIHFEQYEYLAVYGDGNLEAEASVRHIAPGGRTIEVSGAKHLKIVYKSYDSSDAEGFLVQITVLHAGSSPGPASSGTGDREFHFYLELMQEDGSYAAAAEKTYTAGGREEVTGGDGSFRLHAGETAHFEDLGEEGLSWRIKEEADPSCPQVYPADGKALEGTLGSESENRVMFVNGTDGQFLIRKSFAAADGDAEAFLSAYRSGLLNQPFRLLAPLRIETDRNGGMEPYNGALRIADSSDGSVSIRRVCGGVVWLSETQTAILSGLPDGTRISVSEERSNAARLPEDDGKTILFSGDRIFPDQDTVFETAGPGLKEIRFVNRISAVTAQPAALIRKEMTDGEEGWSRIPDGARLAFRVERFAGGSWICAEGVPWIQTDLNYTVGGRVQRTGPDGLIYLVRHADGWEGEDGQNRKIQPLALARGEVRPADWYRDHAPSEGDLRIREDYEASDPAFGYLSVCEENTFYNSNRERVLEVAKETGESSGTRFRMILTQLLDSGEETAACGRSYQIFRIDGDGKEEEGRTGADGSFFLKGGSCARFLLPAGTRWKVREDCRLPWKLDRILAYSGLPEPVREGDGAVFTLEDIVPDCVLTADMLDDVRDPETKEKLQLKQGDVRVPHYVFYHGRILEITQIGTDCFRNLPISSICFSEGILRIGTMACGYCRTLSSVTLPHSLITLGQQAFVTTSISSLDIWENVESAGRWCCSGSLAAPVHIRIHQPEGSLNAAVWGSGTVVEYVTE